MSKESRKITSQIKKLKEVFDDIVTCSELLEIEGVRTHANKGISILNVMETDNEDRRDGE